jgi:hypothetical protein
MLGFELRTQHLLGRHYQLIQTSCPRLQFETIQDEKIFRPVLSFPLHPSLLLLLLLLLFI